MKIEQNTKQSLKVSFAIFIYFPTFLPPRLILPSELSITFFLYLYHVYNHGSLSVHVVNVDERMHALHELGIF